MGQARLVREMGKAIVQLPNQFLFAWRLIMKSLRHSKTLKLLERDSYKAYQPNNSQVKSQNFSEQPNLDIELFLARPLF